MRLGKQNTVEVVLGKKGSGKSRHVKRDVIDPYPGPAVVWDRLDEYHVAGSNSSDPIRSALRFADRDGRSGYARFLAHVASKGLPRRSVIVSGDATFAPFCRWAAENGELLVVIEEADTFCNPSRMPVELAELVRRGRHHGLDLVFVSRAPAEIHRDLTRQLDRLTVFSLAEGRDLEWARHRFGEDVEAKIRSLRDHSSLTITT